MRPLATLTPRNIVSSKRMRVGATTAAPQIATVEIQTTKASSALLGLGAHHDPRRYMVRTPRRCRCSPRPSLDRVALTALGGLYS